MKVRRRIALALCTSKAPLDESERSFIQNVTFNNLGTVLKLGSDSFTLAFGARKVRESDIENCLSTCLAIKEHIPGSKFGVSYGLVSVDEKKDGSIKVEGPITKKVKHLESIASYGQISVDESIIKIYSRIFDIRHVKIKGKDLHNVFGFKEKPSRLRGLREAYGRMVGRDKEFDQLQNLLLQIAKDQGQIVGVVGEAGIGKTRITHELKTLLKMRGLRFYEGSFPYFGGSSYKGFKDIISAIASISSSDEIKIIEQKLRRIGPRYKLENADINFLVNLYSIFPVSETLKHLNEEQLRLGTFVAVKKLLFAIAEDPLVIILEDMQNADELSVALADFLCEGLPDKKLLFFMNYRPEFKGKFEEKIYFNRIKLERFDEAKAKEFLSSLLDISHIPKDLLKLIIRKSAGNPLFIEELVRSLLDKGKIKVIANELKLSGDIKSEDIQPTVHGVISYRMEKLDPGTRKVLQWGSAIGDSVDIKLLKTILGNSSKTPLPSRALNISPPSRGGAKGEGDIARHIETLETRDFIVEKSIYPEEIYRFRHDLIREVAYESVPSSAKKKIHLLIGQYLEKKYNKEIDEHLEDIANHYIASSNHDKGFEFAFRAAEKLKKNYANERAIWFYIEALNLSNFNKTREKESVRKQIITLIKDICILTGDFSKALKFLSDYHNSLRSDDILNLGILNRMKGEVFWRSGNFKLCIEQINESLDIFDRLGDKTEKIRSLSLLVSVYSLAIKIEETKKYARIGLDLIASGDNIEKANFLNRLGYAYLHEGYYKKARNYFSRSARVFESLNNLYELANTYINLGVTYQRQGEYPLAIGSWKTALRIATQIGSLSFIGVIHQNLASIYLREGHFKKAVDEYIYARDILEQCHSLNGLTLTCSNLCYIYHFLGDYSSASKYLEESKRYNQKLPNTSWQAHNLVLEAKLDRDLGNLTAAETKFEKAISIFDMIGDASRIVKVLAELPDLYSMMDNKDKLRDLKQQFATKHLRTVTKETAELIFISKIKIHLFLKEVFGIFDQDSFPDIDNFDYDFQLDTYETLYEYCRHVIRDDIKAEYYLGKVTRIYGDLEKELPTNLKLSLKNRRFYKNYLV